ncbi:MAG: sigma-54-dependent Fis family transcriptional regulator [Planctomycetota bacterium]|nr:sigma-54-dependent Fis family transcriptional regulator [Planctomycetota bacterium]MDA1179035.1 sigma-54-dependent Fis family transcriptional regulator [Planctomycetota bacterium]
MIPTATPADRALVAISEVTELALQAKSTEDFAKLSLDLIRSQLGGQWLLCRQHSSHWQAWHGDVRLLPTTELLAELLDADVPVEQGGAFLVPLRAGLLVLVLVYRGTPLDVRRANEADLSLHMVASVAAVLRAGVQHLANAAPTEQRLKRLEAILQIVWRWSEHRDTEQLLNDLAISATQLVDAERASIFLWDRPRKQLVARPALGVEGQELRVADHLGVVGAVLRSGEPCRVNAEDSHEINREVDQKLGFVTRNLVCVPLRMPSGKCLGAFELINKRSGDFSSEDTEALVDLAHHAAVVLSTAQDRDRLFNSRRQISEQAAEKVRLIGDSPAIVSLRSVVKRVADTDLALLILGENGTGKEVVSQMVHYLSRRRDDPFVAVNCAAIAETLLESELFGHEKGAFTDAHESRAGKFELAARGTLFLDEIGDLSLSGQAKLLRVLEEKIVVRVGGSQPIPTDARVIAATNQDLGKLVRSGKFREDLFFRLNVVTLRLPPLRDRPEDIPQLADYFLANFAAHARRPVPQFTPAAVQRLAQHNWPGNVRELRNMMERLAYLTSADEIHVDDIDFVASPSAERSGPAMGLGLAEATQIFQTDYIDRHVRAARGNLSLAADRLGLHRSNLYRKMKQLGMDADDPSLDSHADS